MIIQDEKESAEHFSHQLGTYFQFVTRNAMDEVSLEREVHHARIYTEIQARRFRNRLQDMRVLVIFLRLRVLMKLFTLLKKQSCRFRIIYSFNT